jgi:hypothetical protein
MDLKKNLFATLLFFIIAIDLIAQFTMYDVTNSGIQNNQYGVKRIHCTNNHTNH